MSLPHVPFIKVHGLGNDFVLLDGLAHDLTKLDFSEFAVAACDRHRGIGGDGLLLLTSSGTADVRMRMWNPDGTEDMCGNGLRCIVRVAHWCSYTGNEFQVETLAGQREAWIKENGTVRVSMGQPSWLPEEIPMIAVSTPHEYSLPVANETLRVSSLSTGSTHTVVWRDELPVDAEFLRLSPLLENHPWFPQRTSVLWAVTEGKIVSLRIWERGAGETLACGTGACAAAVAALDTGRATAGLIEVRSKGGALHVEWDGGKIYKTGPAVISYEGIWQ